MTNMPPPSKPVFGISLSRLYERDGFAVPTLVLKCLQTVMHFGLEVEGIYRVPGNKPIVEKLKSMADAGKSLFLLIQNSEQRTKFYQQMLTTLNWSFWILRSSFTKSTMSLVC
jgi:hypothetical protein